MNVDIFDRATTLVATLTFPNSVCRALGIASVNLRRSCGDGFQITDFGLTGKDLAGVSVSVIDGAGLYMRVAACDTLACDGRPRLLHSRSLARPHHTGLAGAGTRRRGKVDRGADVVA